MEFGLWPLGFVEFLQNNNHQAVNKMKYNVVTIFSMQGNNLSIYLSMCVCV